ncbi:MAG: UDP-N-acetylmuramoyl-L-alanine--D-glutamate ligase [Rickettsiales bacterium]
MIPNIAGKRFGVVGLGKSGRATVASMVASGAEIFAWDDKETTRAAVQKEFTAVHITPVSTWDIAAFSSIVMSPGIMLSHPAVLAAKKHGVEVIGDVELLFRAQPHARYIGITGTNGKSTTTTLIAHILQACGKRVEVGGNLGTPALALAPLEADGIYVLEMSSYQLDLVTTVKFKTAVLLNISPDHLDHHGSMDNYIDAKRHIFDRQGRHDVAVVGIDDATSVAICRDLISHTCQRVIPITATQGVQHGISAQGGVIEGADITAITSLQGEHNWQNAAASYAVARAEGCTHGKIIAAMETYPGLAHRMQWLGAHGGIKFVNDSKATNADAAEKALRTYDGIYWILGGVAKEGGIEPLAHYFPKIRHAFLIGAAAGDFAKTLAGHVEFTQCGSLENAFNAAAAQAQKAGDKTPVILLSPACASFDQFENFEKRGEAFIRLVDAFAAGEKS